MAKVAVIGSGFVGRAWAISFARAGCEVALWDQDKDAPEQGSGLYRAAPARARGQRPSQRIHGERSRNTDTHGDNPRIGARRDGPRSGEHAGGCRGEARGIRRLDAAAPTEAVLASSTSAILPSAFTENLKGRARCLVIHPINPPYLIPAAEIVPAPWTDPPIVERAAKFLRSAVTRRSS